MMRLRKPGHRNHGTPIYGRSRQEIEAGIAYVAWAGPRKLVSVPRSFPGAFPLGLDSVDDDDHDWIERETANRLLGFANDGKLDLLRRKVKIRTRSVPNGFAGERTVYNRRDVEAAAEMMAH